MNEFFDKIESLLNKGILPKKEDINETSLFQEMKSLNFLKKILQDPDTFELIFHCESLIEVISHSKRDYLILPHSRRFIDLAFQWNALEQKVRWNQRNYQSSYRSQIGEHLVRITLLHKVVQNADHKYFVRKRERKSHPLSSFQLPIALDMKNKNILISGATASGKTSFLNAIINDQCQKQHHIIIEDTRELQSESKLVTYLCSEEKLEQYCADALRLSPQNIILGEIRSSEVVPFSLLLTAGHKGLMTTIHANSALDSLERVALLFSLYSRNPMNRESLLTLLSQNLDYLIYMENKRISEILAIRGHKNGHYLYENIGQEVLPEAI